MRVCLLSTPTVDYMLLGGGGHFSPIFMSSAATQIQLFNKQVAEFLASHLGTSPGKFSEGQRVQGSLDESKGQHVTQDTKA